MALIYTFQYHNQSYSFTYERHVNISVGIAVSLYQAWLFENLPWQRNTELGS